MREFTKLASALMILLLSSAIAMGQLNPPTNLTSQVVNDNDVVLSWNAPSSGNGFTEDFESYGDFVLEFSPWLTIDVDGSSTYTMTGTEWPNAGDPQAFMIFNPSTTVPPVESMVAHSGDKFAVCLASIPSPTNDDWLISPQIPVASGDMLSFWVKSFTDQYGLERYNVGVSTTGTDPSDFTIVSGGSYLEAPADDWGEYTYDLGSYVGDNVYIGIQCVSNDAFIFMLDDFSVGSSKASFAFNPNTAGQGSASKSIDNAGISRKEVTAYGGEKSTDELTGYDVYRDGSVIGSTTTELTFTDSGLADGTYEYCVKAVYDEGDSDCSNMVNITLPVSELDAPTNLTADVENNDDVALNWLPPGGGGGANPQWIQWDDGVNAGNGIGLTTGGTFYCASHWNPADLFDYNGMSVTQLTFFPYGDPTATYVLKVWTGASAANEVFSMDVTSFTADEFNTYDITPIVIDATMEYWFGYVVTHGEGTNPAGVDAGPAVQELGDMISFDGVAWTGMSAAYNLDFNWNISVYVDDLKNSAPAQVLVKSTYPVSSGTFVESGASGKISTFNPGSPKDLTGYNIYRDGVVIGNTTETSYMDMDLAPGTYEYCVTAVYDEGESVCSNNVEATIEDSSFETFEDNFDSYNAGEQLACQNPDDWTTWSNAPCGSEDPYISTDFANTAPNAVLIEGTNDLVHVFPNYTEGAYKISFNMYVPTGFDGYFNTLADFAGGTSIWGMQVYFYGSGGSVDAGGEASATFAVTYDEWFLNEILVDLDNDWATYKLNGVELVSWVWSTGTFGQGNLNQLGGNNFYAGFEAGVGTPKYYFDDYKVEGFEAPPPVLAPSNLTGPDVVTVGSDIDLTWDAPGGSEWIHWDDGENTGNGIGLTTGGTFFAASHWTASDLTNYIGLSISKISFFPYGDPGATFTLKVWSGANAATEELSQDVTFEADIWNEVDLTSPVVIAASTEYWIGYEVTHLEGTNPAGVDAGPAVQGSGDMISFDAAAWVSMGGEYNLDFNWNIQAFVGMADKGSLTPISKPTPVINNPAGDLTSAIENGTANGVKSPFAPQESKELLGYNVYRNDSEIGYTTETFYTDENVSPVGLYTYCVTAVWDEGESICSNEHIVDVITGINENLFMNTQVFPNPASDMVSVKSDMQISNVKVFNNTGQVISNEQVDTKLYQLNTSQFGSGIYFFQIETTEGVISKRIIIQ